MYDLNETIRKEIIACCKKYHVNKIILFGSRARGDNSPHSDIDLAIEGADDFSSLDLYGASVRGKEESDDIRHCFHLENESSGGDITLYRVFPYSICPNTSPSPAWIRRSARLSIGVVDLLIRTSLCPL